MGTRLKAPFTARVNAGGVLTFAGTAVGQAVYWFLDAIDPRPGYGPWPAVGRLQRPRFRVSPVRYGTKFRYGILIPYGGVVRWKPPEVNDYITLVDGSLRATVAYFAPEGPPLVRYGMHYKFGEVKWGQESGLYDQVTVKTVSDQ
jgi:hypothetical protein